MSEEVQSQTKSTLKDRQDIISALDEKKPYLLTEDGKHRLRSTWRLYRHAKDCDDWDISSYEIIAQVSTVEDFWSLYNGMPSLLNEDMWFFMRDDIPPRWEDQRNREGGTWQFRIEGEKVDNTWLTLSMILAGENICLRPEDSAFVCGISLSQKANYATTISVWNLNSKKTAAELFRTGIEGINFALSRYRPHGSRKLGPAAGAAN